MAYQKFCRACGADISSKRLDARYCSEKCSKRFRRRRAKSAAPSAHPKRTLGDQQYHTLPHSPDKGGLGRTHKPSRTEKIADKVISKTIDVLANLSEAKLKEKILINSKNTQSSSETVSSAHDSPDTKQDQQQTVYHEPLIIRTGEEIAQAPTYHKLSLPPRWANFLGDVPIPHLKMLVWGANGSGKSSWAMRFLRVMDEYSFPNSVSIYCSAEEDIEGATIQHRQKLIGITKARFINRLPHNALEWHNTMISSYPDQPENNYYRHVLVIDSISVLGISPYYFDDLLREAAEPSFPFNVGNFLARKTTQVFIAHATKDGREYIGASDWAHEVDMVIECSKVSGRGQAIIRKNRFAAADGRGAIGTTMDIWQAPKPNLVAQQTK